MRLVVDAGPVIALAKIDLLEVLPKLFQEIVVPETVLREVAPRGEVRPGAEIRRMPWIRRMRADVRRRKKLERDFDIDAGEAEAILVSERSHEETILLIDEVRGRACALQRGVKTLRTGALLVLAYEMDIVSKQDLESSIEYLCSEHYWSRAVADQIHALIQNTAG